jgi:hypothetical protein
MQFELHNGQPVDVTAAYNCGALADEPDDPWEPYPMRCLDGRLGIFPRAVLTGEEIWDYCEWLGAVEEAAEQETPIGTPWEEYVAKNSPVKVVTWKYEDLLARTIRFYSELVE